MFQSPHDHLSRS
uniref:Uncharacterized protein n=1 Tax=Arundo donax TaxID=35708 RepID=A0A0A9AZU0_ARUDO